MENRTNTSSDSDCEFFLETIFYEDSNEELVPDLIEKSDEETDSDDTDDGDTELVEPKGIKQANANVCNETETPDGSEQNNNTTITKEILPLLLKVQMIMMMIGT